MAQPTSAGDEPTRKNVLVRLRGRAATRWLELLAEEGGTEQYHAQAALEAYCLTKGYGPKPADAK